MKYKCETKFHYLLHVSPTFTPQANCRNLHYNQHPFYNYVLKEKFWHRDIQWQRIYQLCNYKTLYPPISRITFEQLRISKYFAQFYQRTSRCRWQDAGSLTNIFSRHFQGWPAWTIPTSITYYARTKLLCIILCVSHKPKTDRQLL